jgi:hypothetical protein
MGKRKPKEHGVTWYRKQIKDIFNPLITSLGYCQRCGSINSKFHCSHVLTIKNYRSLQFNPINTVCLCYYCHLQWWHKEPFQAVAWYKEKFPNRYIYLQEAMKHITKMNIPRYQEILKMVQKRDLRGLMKLPT